MTTKMKLSRSQRDLLVGTRFGFVTYGFGFDTYHLYKQHFSCPTVHSTTTSGRVLARLGLITVPTQDGYPCNASLSEIGAKLVEELLTEDERAGLKYLEEMQDRQEERQKRQKLESAFDDKHRAETNQLRASGPQLAQAAQKNDEAIMETALKIGNGSNRVDDLIAQLKTLTVEKSRIKEERAAIQARMDALWKLREEV